MISRMAGKTLFIGVLCMFFLCNPTFAYTQPKQEQSLHEVAGTLLSLSPNNLKVERLISASSRVVYDFKLTGKTRFIGTPEVGKKIIVRYLRKKLNRNMFRLIALSVEVPAY